MKLSTIFSAMNRARDDMEWTVEGRRNGRSYIAHATDSLAVRWRKRRRQYSMFREHVYAQVKEVNIKNNRR